MFVTFEGPEGSGKTTQVQLLADALRERGQQVVVAREPGATPVGEAIRQVVLGLDRERRLGARAEALLFAAARAQLVDDVIRPAIERGEIVICDRFSDSTIAYQVGGRGLSGPSVRTIVDFAADGLLPDLTFFLDLRVEVGSARKFGDRPDRLEREATDFHERVVETYRGLARAEPGRIVRIDAERSVSSIASDILSTVLGYLRTCESEKGSS